MMIVAMIENPAGVDIVDKIAAVPGIDVVFVASTDLGSFSGLRQGDPKYEALVTRGCRCDSQGRSEGGRPTGLEGQSQRLRVFPGPAQKRR